MGDSNWNDEKWRSGWYARRRYDKKRRPLWILLGVLLAILLKPLSQFVLWSLFHD